MTNQIGDYVLDNVASYQREGNHVTLIGFANTRNELNQLLELFRKTPGGVQILSTVGGHEVVYDITPGSVLTKYCIFDSDKAQDGWYILLPSSFHASSFTAHFPYTIHLFFIGVNAFVKEGYSLHHLSEVSNDWES